MKKGATIPEHILFQRNIKKRRWADYRRSRPEKEVFKWVVPNSVIRVSWWRRLLKFLHIL